MLKFMCLCFFLLPWLAGDASPRLPPSQIDFWISVPPGQSTFSHTLGVRPRVFEGWVLPFVGAGQKDECQIEADLAATPLEYVPSLRVEAVSPESVIVFNAEDVARCLQVVLRP